MNGTSRAGVSGRLSALLLAALLAFAAAGCRAYHAGGRPTEVAQGRYYATGNQRFDRFFVEVYDRQNRMAASLRALDSARAQLAADLGLADVARPKVIEAVARAAREHENSGASMRLILSTKSGADVCARDAWDANLSKSEVAVVTNRPARGNARRFQSAIEATAKAVVYLIVEAQSTELALERMQLEALSLESAVDVAFRTESYARKSEIRANLSDALRIAVRLRARAGDAATDARALLAELAAAVTTDTGRLAAAPADARAKPEPKPVKKSSPPRRAAPRSGGAPKAPAKAPAEPPKRPKAAPGPFEP
jgi:hypothetical protein